jgi:hypothetical protein
MTYPKGIDKSFLEAIQPFFQPYGIGTHRFNVEPFRDIKPTILLKTIEYVQNTEGAGKFALLERVAYGGCKELFEFLLSIPGINVHKKSRHRHRPPFASIIDNSVENGGNVELLLLLLAHPSFDVNRYSKRYGTLLMYALRKNVFSSETIEKILNTPGIDISKTDEDGKTAFDIAYKNLKIWNRPKNQQIMDLFKKQYADKHESIQRAVPF